MSPREIGHSQNFIRNPKLVRDLLDLSNIGPDDLVVEIGPGKGIITQSLLERARRVIAVEKDPELAAELALRFSESNFQLVAGDFLQWQLPHEKYKVYSNIPFNYTADIVTKLTSSTNSPDDIYLIMQEAAAHRFVGMPYIKNSQTSILLAIDFTVRILRRIDRSSFIPIPNVNIVFSHFSKRIELVVPLTERQSLRDFIVYGYNRWAPTLLDAYKDVFTKRQLGIISRTQNLADLKPSDLNIDQWINLYNTYRQFVSEEKKSLIYKSEKRLKKSQSKLDKQHRTRDSG